MASFNSTVLARVAAALYDVQLGNETMDWALEQVNFLGGINAVANSVYNTDFSTKSNAEMATLIVKNLGVTGTAVATGEAAVLQELNNAPAGQKGAVVVAIVNVYSTLTSHPDFGAFAKAFNAQVTAAVAYAATAGTTDIPVHPELFFNITAGTFAGGASARLTGDQDVRIDLGNTNHQFTGLDLDGDGGIDTDAKENNFAYLEANNAVIGANHSGFKVVDAYARNPLNTSDAANNFLGNIYFDGTGFAGDGKATNGNIFLGGLAADIALGGVGNDFLVGGGNVGGINGSSGSDDLQGGRNADMFFVELSQLSSTDGNNALITGGTTADDTIAAGTGGGLGTQDNDILLLEASDDDEPITYAINEGTQSARNIAPNLTTASGTGARVVDVEGVNASGNLYGFLNSLDTVIGARAYDGYGDAQTAGSENYGRGSTGQLNIIGSSVANLIIGGYDNDNIAGNAGNDLLMGGDLRYLITNKNNPNLLDDKGGLKLTNNSVATVNDGKDALDGGSGNDNIVFESDGGTIAGGTDTGKISGNTLNATDGVTNSDDRNYAGPRASSQGDALWLTNFSMGRLGGATIAGEATAQGDALAKLTTDSTYRVDLGNSGTAAFKNYGGANSTSSDQTNYVSVSSNNGTVPRVTISGMETVNTTGLGAIDYKAAGSNTPDLTFTNQQNYNGLNASVDLRGNAADNVLLANTGTDTVEGRTGDDVTSGGSGNDKFVVQFGDNVDWIARPVDANGDSLWDTTGGLVVTGGLAWGQDFRPPAAATAGTTTLVVDFGTTVLNGVDTFVATFQVRIDGTDYGTTIPVATLAAAKSTAEVAAIVNPVFQAANKNVSVVATSPTTIEVRAIDSTPGDGKLPVVGLTAADGFFVTGQASGTGTYQAKGSILGAEGTNLEDDRLIIKSYEDRAINLGVDQTKFETNEQASEMVTKFGTSGSQFAEGQAVRVYLDSVREGDTVSVTINGTVYKYTLIAGETAATGGVAGGGAATSLANVINRTLDINAASGRVAAAIDLASFGDAADTGAQQAAILITQTDVAPGDGTSLAFMDLTASVTRADGAVPFGSVATHNQSNTYVDMLGFDARNGALFSQDKDLSPVILFQGRNTGTTSNSVLLTAKNAGGALNGTDAVLAVTGGNGAWNNGDDLLIGGDGNDTIDGKTGDDRILMSKGVDTVIGGGNATSPTQAFTDVLQAEEQTFGTGTSFKVTLSGVIGTTGAGTVTAVDSKGVATADVTTFSGIELVRVLENNRLSELDVKALSDAVAAAVGTNPIISNASSSLATPAAAVAGVSNASDEGLYIAVTATPSTTYSIDANNDGTIDRDDPAEQFTATAVLGTESVTSGGANDFVYVDYTQITANNKFTLGGQQANDTTRREGADWVVYDNTAIGTTLAGTVVGDRPVVQLNLLGASTSSVKLSGGLLGTTDTYTDSLNEVEVVSLSNAATRTTDVLDVSAITAGVTINYGAQVEVGKSNGGTDVAPNSAATQEADKLETGGLAPVGAGLGNEWLEVAGITQLERVTGSAGGDRVILADTMNVATAITGAANAFTSTAWITNLFLARAGRAVSAATAGGTPTATVNDNGLYRFSMAGGVDSIDFSQETQLVAVWVDTTTGDKDLLLIGSGDLTGAGERIDQATSVERYYAGASGAPGAATNIIDLSAATVATTIQFSKEAFSNVPSNDAAEPNGFDAAANNSNLTRSAEVRDTANNTVFATFIDRTGNSDVGMAARAWDVVAGSETLAESVVMTDNESTFKHWLDLAGGANSVNYSARTGTITAVIGAVDSNNVDGIQFQASTADGDDINQGLYEDNASNFLTITASARAGDNVNIAGLLASTAVTRVVSTVLTATSKPTLSQVDPKFNMVDLATGTVTEAVFGQWALAAAPNTVAGSAAFFTRIAGFENATNAGSAESAHMIGDNGRNSITGGTVVDYLIGARGIAGDGSADVGAGNRGDRLTGGTGADWFIYRTESESPNGSVSGGEQSGTIFPGIAPTNDNNVINSRDTVTDFVAGTDKLVFNVSDTYDSIRSSAAVPGNLGAALNAGVPLVTVFAAGDTTVTIGKTAATAGTVDDFDNYRMDTTAATLTLADLILRVGATSASDVIDASAGLAVTNLNAASADGLQVDVVYTAANQSQAGGFDQLIHFTPGVGGDRIDLSFLKLARYEVSNASTGVNYDTNADDVVDAVAGAAATTTLIRALGAAPVFAVNGSAPNLFIDGTTYRPTAFQTLQDGNGDVSTTLFIDVNGDGNYVPTDDMVVVLVGVDGGGLVNDNIVTNLYGGVFGG